jgi:hypothetical protein
MCTIAAVSAHMLWGNIKRKLGGGLNGASRATSIIVHKPSFPSTSYRPVIGLPRRVIQQPNWIYC